MANQIIVNQQCKKEKYRTWVRVWLLTLMLSGCFSVPETPRPPTTPPTTKPQFKAVSWTTLPGWTGSSPTLALSAFLKSCVALAQDTRWAQACEQASMTPAPDAVLFFERAFVAYELSDGTGNRDGLLTGYYEPLLHGSRVRSERYRYPVYGVPGDLLRVELSALYPDLVHQRVRGRVVGNKLVPYYSRSDIDDVNSPVSGRELMWVDDAVSLFFLHIQGSGKVALEEGPQVRLAYADQNGHPYKAIGKVLVDRGELKREEVTLQSIRAWLNLHPDKAVEVMQQNPSYVFFEEQPDSAEGPKGAQGVALTAGYSIAVDPRVIPLGAPVYLDALSPGDSKTLNRLAIAQDTGGAIRGAVRADLFLGHGETAEDIAGRMRQPLRVWVLLPQGFAPL